MNFPRLLIGLFSVSAVSSLIPGLTPTAKAVCVALDVSNQIAVHSRDRNAKQINNSNQYIDPNCYGNTSVHTGNQTYTGSGNADQVRNSTQILGPGHNPTGVKSPNIQIQVPVQVDVPALR